MSAGVLAIALVSALVAYMATDRKEAGIWLRFGLYSAALAVCAASFWLEVVMPLRAADSFRALAAPSSRPRRPGARPSRRPAAGISADRRALVRACYR